MDRTACIEPQCLYKGALYLYFFFLEFYFVYFTVQNNRRDYRTLCCLIAVILWIAVLLGVQEGQQLQQKMHFMKNNL